MNKAPVPLLNSGNIIRQKWMAKIPGMNDDDEISINVIINYIKIQIDPTSKDGNHMLLLRAATGSGKSMVLPVYLYNTFAPLGRANIIMSQPTRITATDIPLSILKYNKEFHLEENIGYQTGVLARKPRRGIIFITIGILLQYFKIMPDEDICKKFGFIVIDEVHNRSIDLDQTLCYVKKFLERVKKNNQLRVPYFILMSATFHPEVYIDYFGLKPNQFIDARGVSYPITKHFSQFSATNYITYILDLVLKIHIENLDDAGSLRHILIFLPGAAIIKEIAAHLVEMNKTILSQGLPHAQQKLKEILEKTGGAREPIEILPISILSETISKGSEDYLNLYAPSKMRKVILATNVVETGITIPDLKYVIESGLVKEVSFNPNFGCTTIMDKNVNQSSVRQRIGRVGRNAPGIAYHCYTEDTYNAFYSNSIPDVLKEDIAPFILGMIIQETKTDLVEGINNSLSYQINKFEQKYYTLQSESRFDGTTDLITPPSYDSYLYAMEKLYSLGFINDTLTPTLYGFYANKIRKLRLENIRMIFAGYHRHVSVLSLITIACMSQILSLEKKTDMQNSSGDDFIDYLRAWYASDPDPRVVELRDEVIENFLIIGLNPYYLSELDTKTDEYTNQTTNQTTTNNVNQTVDESHIESRIKLCIQEGYRLNACTWNEKMRMYISDHYHLAVSVNKESHANHIIVSSITLQSNKKSKEGLYKFVGKDVSIL